MRKRKEPVGVVVSPELLWSVAVKLRDEDACVACGCKDELSAVLVEGGSVVTDEGKLDVPAGLTLCPQCRLRHSSSPKFKREVEEAHKRRMAGSSRTMRLNAEVDRDLYVKFQAICRFGGTSVSKAIRALVMGAVAEAEGV